MHKRADYVEVLVNSNGDPELLAKGLTKMKVGPQKGRCWLLYHHPISCYAWVYLVGYRLSMINHHCWNPDLPG